MKELNNIEKKLFLLIKNNNWINSKELEKKTNLKTRFIVDLIKNIRNKGIPIISSKLGYKLATKEQDVNSYIKSRINEINKEVETLNIMSNKQNNTLDIKNKNINYSPNLFKRILNIFKRKKCKTLITNLSVNKKNIIYANKIKRDSGKWRKKAPNQHRSYGERRERDNKIIDKEGHQELENIFDKISQRIEAQLTNLNNDLGGE